jgi:hypothetical protein
VLAIWNEYAFELIAEETIWKEQKELGVLDEQHVTAKNIGHLEESANFKVCTFNKHCNNLILMSILNAKCPKFKPLCLI